MEPETVSVVTELLQLIDRYGVSLLLAAWLLYRDWRFLRKLEAVLDGIADAVRGRAA